MSRFWFDKQILSEEWFHQHLLEAQAQAGHRYSPQLTVSVPAFDALEAFGLTDEWFERLEEICRELKSRSSALKRGIDYNGHTVQERMPFPPDARAAGETSCAVADNITDFLKELRQQPAKPEDIDHSLNQVDQGLEQVANCESSLRHQLEEKHGAVSESQNFRQYEAEYMLRFPAANLDDSRKLASALRRTRGLLETLGSLSAATRMLLYGPAGIGKTHALVDHAFRRFHRKIWSVVVFGEDFYEEPWLTLRRKLGFGANLSRDALFSMLDTAGAASAKPLVIYIDAINESPKRSRWKQWLPTLVSQLAPYGNLRVCVSCRDTYLRDVADHWETIPRFHHDGFAECEFEAATQFCSFYKLDPPSSPLFLPEFSNPLFLRIVCESAQDRGLHSLPIGHESLAAVIEQYLNAKNRRISEALGYDEREQRVNAAVERIVKRLISNQARQLPFAEAKELVDLEPSLPRSRSLFDQLEHESIISVFPLGSSSAAGEYGVKLTFERIADHLIAKHFLEGRQSGTLANLFSPSGPLHFVTRSPEDAAQNAGLLSALAIHLSERFGVELESVAPNLDEIGTLRAMVEGLPWRQSSSITTQTKDFVVRALSKPELAAKTLDVLLLLAARENHPLNAKFIHELMSGVDMVSRDPFWAASLTKSFDSRSSAWRLIDWSLRYALAGLSEEAAFSWKITLAWFCASPDRRVRDRATKGLVRLLCQFPASAAQLIREFAECDDEYVLERVAASAYASSLLMRDNSAIMDSCSAFAEMLSKREMANASIRDHVRLTAEFAIDNGITIAPEIIGPLRPPYQSQWPLTIPSKTSISAFAKRFPELKLDDFSDFGRYVVANHLLDKFDLRSRKLDREKVFRWFLNQIQLLGYPGPQEMAADYDRAIIATHGRGRAKARWAERLGKKYYWIIYHRLAGVLADHATRRPEGGATATLSSEDRLQALDLRDIDPTDIRYWQKDQANREWNLPNAYKFNLEVNDANWVTASDFSNSKLSLSFDYPPSGSSWVVLKSYSEWTTEKSDDRNTPYRFAARLVNAVIVQQSQFAAFRKEVEHDGGRLNLLYFDPQDYKGYLAEYPTTLPYRQRLSTGELAFHSDLKGLMVRVSHLQQLSRPLRKGFD